MLDRAKVAVAGAICAVVRASAAALAITALGASGAAVEVRYPDAVPVYAGLLAGTPSGLFALGAGYTVWRQTARRVRIDPQGLFWGAVPLLLAIALVLTYATYVGDPEHYKGYFNEFRQEWVPRFKPLPYLALIVGVATFIPMGALGALTKLLYIDAIRPAKLDQPEGFDPIGVMLRTQRPRV
jgi:hypothetical protein